MVLLKARRSREQSDYTPRTSAPLVGNAVRGRCCPWYAPLVRTPRIVVAFTLPKSRHPANATLMCGELPRST